MKSGMATRRLATAGLIAALYTALTVGLAPISFGMVQCRVAEALTALCVFTPWATAGLTVGCAVSNLLGLSLGGNVAGLMDVILGPLATGVAAWLSYRWRARRLWGLPLLSALPPVVINALVVGTELAAVSPHFTWAVWCWQAALVAVGEAVACGLGLVLFKLIDGTRLGRLIENKE